MKQVFQKWKKYYMASVIMENVFMATILWQVKLSQTRRLFTAFKNYSRSINRRMLI